MNLDDYQRAVAGDGRHTYSAAPCAACGDLDGCHKKAPEVLRKKAVDDARKASRVAEKPVFRRLKPMIIERRWNVPPDNSVHVVMAYHEAQNAFYLALEDLDPREEPYVWRHRAGSSCRRSTESEALDTAERLWKEEQEKSGGRSRFRR